MVVLVLVALGAASIANLGTGTAQFRRFGTAALHEGCGQAADLGTIDVERDAARQHLHIGLLQAGAGTVFAGGRAVVAGIDTGLIVLLHASLLYTKANRLLPPARVCHTIP
jgi:hypothetical protein